MPTLGLIERIPTPADVAGQVHDFIRQIAQKCHPTDRWLRPSGDARFREIARRLFTAQFATNAPFRGFCVGRGVTPASLRDWREIPAVPTAAFKDLDLTCLLPADRTVAFHSSGTTEQRPGRNFHSADSLALYEASLKPWFAANVLTGVDEMEKEGRLVPPDRPAFLVLTPPTAAVPHSSLIYMLDVAVRSFGAQASIFVGRLSATGAWALDLERLVSELQESMSANRPTILVGTAFNFVHLLDYFAESKLHFRLPPDSTGIKVRLLCRNGQRR